MSAPSKLDRIEASIAWRTRDMLDRRVFVPVSELVGWQGPDTLHAFDTERRMVFPLNGGDSVIGVEDERFALMSRSGRPQGRLAKVSRTVQHANALSDAGLNGVFIYNMKDAQDFDYRTLSPNWDATPVFQYCRSREGSSNVILVPLSRWYSSPEEFHNPRPGYDPIPFEAKRQRAVWRGSPTGLPASGTDLSNRSLSLVAAIGEIQDGQGEPEEGWEAFLQRYLRFRVVRTALSMPRVDARFVHPQGGADGTHALPGYVSDLYGQRIKRENQLRNRYLLALEGYDAPSGLYWALASNSVVFCAPRRWEVILDEGLEPWVHYVPIADDGSDIEQKIDWCEAHPDRCRDIIAAAHDAMAWMCDLEYRDIVDHEVWRRYLDKAIGAHRVGRSFYSADLEHPRESLKISGASDVPRALPGIANPVSGFIEARIVGRRPRPGKFAETTMEDFLVDGQKAADGLNIGGFLPYASDFRARWLCFVDTSGEQVVEDPFLYLSQYEHASRCLFLHEDSLPEKLVQNSREPITFLFSIGRCGSTLAVRLANASGYLSISECDAFLGLPEFQGAGRRPKIERLLKVVGGALVEYAGGTPLLVKMRSYSSAQAPWFTRCFPNARFIYLSRDFTAWSRSSFRVLNREPESLLSELRMAVEAHEHFERVGRSAGVIRYEDMIERPESFLDMIGGSGSSKGHAPDFSSVLGSDSQNGLLAQPETRDSRFRERQEDLLRLIEASPDKSKLLRSPIVYGLPFA